jgi:hypothetical protein
MIHKKYSIQYLLSFLLVIMVLLSVVGCEPETKITFDNQHNNDITIFVTHVRENGSTDVLTNCGIVPANTAKTLYIIFIGDKWVNRISGKDSLGNSIFSHDYSREDLKKIGWKITIQK